MILDNIEETGQNIRKWYQRKLPSNPNKDYYYIIRNTSPAESILVEYAFLDSTKDDRKQIKNDWEKWAESVVKAVADYKGYNYTAPGANTVNDTYTVARLMNQAIPVGFFITPRDRIVCFKTTDYVEDIQEIMTKKRFRDFPIEDENGNYVGTISRRNLLRSGRKKVILVDHNEKNQAVNGIEDTEILEIIDHHRLGPIQTITPVFFRNQPLGCTGTIIYKMYQEAGINIEPVIAGLMCSAIISDTLIFKSPTCTSDDIDAAMELADIAGIDPEVYGRQMFGAGSNLDEKTDREIFYQDFKKFAINDVTVGVGQVNAMGPEDIEKIKAKEVPFIDTVTGDGGLDVVYFLMTDISTECSYVLCSGKNADTIMSLAFGVDKQQDTYILKNVVSRKKQFLPAIMEAMEQ